MKKLTLILIAVFVSSIAFAQDTSVVYKPKTLPKNTYSFSFEPIQIFLGGFYVSYEQKLKNDKILRFRTGLRVAEELNFYGFNGLNDVTEFQLEAQYRVMVSPNYSPLSGVYVSPFIGYRGIGFRENNSVITTPTPGGTTFTNPGRSASAVSFGFLMGVQRVMRSGFLFDVSFGGGIQLPSGDYDLVNWGDIFEPYHKGVIPKGTLSFGVAF